MAGITDKLKAFDLKQVKEKLGSMFLGPQDILGIDIGSYAIKVVWLKEEGGQMRLKTWGHLPIESKADAAPDERRQQSINQLRAFLIQKALPVKRAATAISGNSVIVRYVKFPLLTKSELRETLASEAEPFIPFDIKDVQLSFHILSEVMEEGQKKMETVLVASKKDMVQARVEVLEAVGLRPAIIDVDSFALEGVHERTDSGQERGGSTLYLNIGHTTTNLSIIEAGVTRVVRDIFIAGATFTKAAMKALQCDAAKAEEAKKSFGLLLDQGEKEKALAEGNRDALAVSQAVTGVMKDLVAEVHRSVDFYLSQGPERSVARIVLAGGSARMKNLAKHLTGELKVPVSQLNPLGFLGQPAEIPAEILPSFGVAAGLALRRPKDWV
ncbi:MAG: type IV pilus assembly protein PilM [Elusimicrobia bacterium]|nr:type IV pilus assembly protein PilM [Elusimicrobiota bacterium]